MGIFHKFPSALLDKEWNVLYPAVTNGYS